MEIDTFFKSMHCLMMKKNFGNNYVSSVSKRYCSASLHVNVHIIIFIAANIHPSGETIEVEVKGS